MLYFGGYLYTKRRTNGRVAQPSTFVSADQIFHASTGSCSNEVLANLPKESVIKRTINNHKALPPIELVGMNGVGQIPET